MDYDSKPLQLTDLGRECALRVLSATSLPTGVTWQLLKKRYLVAAALGIQPRSKQEWERLGTADGLRAALLTKHYQLPLAPVPTIARVLHALAWMQLTKAHDTTQPLEKDFTRNAVISATLLDGRPSKQPEAVLAARVVGSASSQADSVREAVIGRWLRNGLHPPADQSLSALTDFCTRVRESAARMTTGKFGEHRVFISYLWDRFRQDHADAELTREAFDKRLVEANREGLLALSRADLVSGMNVEDVQQSEIRLPHTTFHFVRTDQ